jgi:hypothetical protein
VTKQPSFCIRLAHGAIWLAALLAAPGISLRLHAEEAGSAKEETDVLVVNNGDTLHGKFVNEIDGKVTFHTDAFGDITLGWDKIKELRTNDKFAVLDKTGKSRSKKAARRLPTGTLVVENKTVTVTPEGGPAEPPIPVENAQFIMEAATLDKQINREPGILSAWQGMATAGAAIVTATQKQYTVSGGISLVRTVPTVSWLNPRNRSSIDFTGSFGKIMQPSYTIVGPPPVLVPAVTTKSVIYHAGAERDQYFSPRLFALAQTAFDHNYSQDLELQQIYGGGIGWTAIKNSRQQLDLKATLQYEKQQFISSSSSNQNLFGSTYSAGYLLHTRLFTYTQSLSFIPAYSNSHAYSATETNSFAFPAYKNLSFSVGTLDSYLNNPPASLPPTQRNSFQFTMGITYAIKSKY